MELISAIVMLVGALFTVIAGIGLQGMLLSAKPQTSPAAKFRAAARYLVEHPGEAAALAPFAAILLVFQLQALSSSRQSSPEARRQDAHRAYLMALNAERKAAYFRDRDLPSVSRDGVAVWSGSRGCWWSSA